jgi:hypothetical protein
MQYTDTMKHSNTRTGQKLSRFKNKASEWSKKHSHSVITWQELAKHEFKFGPGYNRYGVRSGFEEMTEKSGAKIVTGVRFSNLWFHCDPSEIPGHRTHDDSNDLLRLNHKGWYCDDFQHETVRGVVGVFRWGKKVYIVPGVMYSGSDCHYFDLTQSETLTPCEAFDEVGDQTDTLADTMCEVARMADQMAETTAEEAREADQEYQAEQLCEQLKDSIGETRIEIKTLIREIKNAGKSFSPAICDALTSKVSELRGHIEECRKALKTIESSPWEYSEFYSLV